MSSRRLDRFVKLSDVSEPALLGVLIEDLSALDMQCAGRSDVVRAAAEQEAVYTEATAVLARIHRHFAGKVRDLLEVTEAAKSVAEFRRRGAGTSQAAHSGGGDRSRSLGDRRNQKDRWALGRVYLPIVRLLNPGH